MKQFRSKCIRLVNFEVAAEQRIHHCCQNNFYKHKYNIKEKNKDVIYINNHISSDSTAELIKKIIINNFTIQFIEFMDVSRNEYKIMRKTFRTKGKTFK